MGQKILTTIPENPEYGDIALIDPMFGITAYWNGEMWRDTEIYNDQGELEAEIVGLRKIPRECTCGTCQLMFDFF
jgi:hypothetical protein